MTLAGQWTPVRDAFILSLLGVDRVVSARSFPLPPFLTSCEHDRDLTQIGLGDSETEHTGDEPGEMGDNLSVANLGGVYVSMYVRLDAIIRCIWICCRWPM